MAPLVEVVYAITVHTSHKRGAGTDANVFIELHGEVGRKHIVQNGFGRCTSARRSLIASTLFKAVADLLTMPQERCINFDSRFRLLMVKLRARWLLGVRAAPGKVAKSALHPNP